MFPVRVSPRRLLPAACLLAAAPAAFAVSPAAAYRAALQQARPTVQSCAAAQNACLSRAIGSDRAPARGEPAIRLDWLRSAINQAHSAKPADRTRLMQQASARIAQEIAFLDAPPAKDLRARSVADTILRQRQFRFVDARPSRWQLLQARFWAWVDRVFLSAAEASAHRPWIGELVEWSCLAAALAGILAYAFRLLRRERLRFEFPWNTHPGDTPQEDTDWAARASAAAASGAWRDAIHALYWATIRHLAGAGRWRTLAQRTPREYLLLLQPDTAHHQALRTLTGLLERAWYGRRAATELDYRGAHQLATQLGVPLDVSLPRGAA